MPGLVDYGFRGSANNSGARQAWQGLAGLLEQCSQGCSPTLHLLASPTTPAVARAALIVDFRAIYSLPVGYLSRHAGQFGDRWRLRSPFLEHFSQALARSFMRVGLPASSRSKFTGRQRRSDPVPPRNRAARARSCMTKTGELAAAESDDKPVVKQKGIGEMEKPLRKESVAPRQHVARRRHRAPRERASAQESVQAAGFNKRRGPADARRRAAPNPFGEAATDPSAGTDHKQVKPEKQAAKKSQGTCRRRVLRNCLGAGPAPRRERVVPIAISGKNRSALGRVVPLFCAIIPDGSLTSGGETRKPSGSPLSCSRKVVPMQSPRIQRALISVSDKTGPGRLRPRAGRRRRGNLQHRRHAQAPGKRGHPGPRRRRVHRLSRR